MPDRDRLLDGEDPSTTRREDAEHWLVVYGRLLGFKQNVIGTAQASEANLPQPAQEEAEADVEALEEEQQQVKRRYEFWRSRLRDLS